MITLFQGSADVILTAFYYLVYSVSIDNNITPTPLRFKSARVSVKLPTTDVKTFFCVVGC